MRRVQEFATIREATSYLRKQWMTWPKKFVAVQRQAERVKQPNGREKTFIRCMSCECLFNRAEMQVDHIVPVGPLVSLSSDDVRDYKERLFCHPGNLQALCKPCHRAKSETDWQVFH